MNKISIDKLPTLFRLCGSLPLVWFLERFRAFPLSFSSIPFSLKLTETDALNCALKAPNSQREIINLRILSSCVKNRKTLRQS